MSFLFPSAAWLGLLSLAIVTFYLLKTRQRRKPVSTLLFWNRLKPKVENSPFWRKLRRWISLALQLLIFALVLVALMHPAFDWEQRAPRRIVAVLDPSASMQAQRSTASRWQLARDQLGSAIERLRIQDEMAILTAETPPRILSGWTSSKSELRLALQSAEVLPIGTDPSAALALAAELAVLRDNAAVEVFSDSVWPPSAKAVANSGLTVFGVDANPPSNAGMTLFAVRRSPLTPGDWQLDIEVNSPTAFSGTVEILKDGVPMDLAQMQCGPGAPWLRSWNGTSEAGASFEAILKPSPGDMLAIDNRAGARLAELSPVRVVVVGEENPFLDAVLDSIPLVQWKRVKDFPAGEKSEADLVIASGAYLPSGKLKSALLLISPAKGGFWGEREGDLTDAPVTEITKTSRLMNHASLAQVAIEEAGKWRPAPGSEVLASSMDNPLVFGQWDRSSRWLVVGFDPARSDLQLRTAFPILIGNLIQSLRSETELAEAAAILPGRVETDLRPLAPGDAGDKGAAWAPILPGWWLVMLAGLLFLLLDWMLFNRRITD